LHRASELNTKIKSFLQDEAFFNLHKREYFEMKTEFEKLIKELSNEALIEYFNKKQIKKKKKKEWLKRRKQIANKRQKYEKQNYDLSDQLIDTWRSTVNEKERAAQQSKENEKIGKKQEEEDRKKKKKLQEHDESLPKLELLLRLRLQKLAQVPGGYREVVTLQLEQFINGLEVESKPQVAVNENNPEKEKDTNVNNKVKINEQQNMSDYWINFYTQGNNSLEKLIEIRREWDQHINENNGSGIPPYFIEPPVPSSKKWAAYLIPNDDELLDDEP